MVIGCGVGKTKETLVGEIRKYVDVKVEKGLEQGPFAKPFSITNLGSSGTKW